MSEERMNQGYKIIQAIPVGEVEYVLGINIKNPDRFVTWECSGKDNYYWGHYLNDQLSAIKDLCQRTMDKVEFYQQWQEKVNQGKQRNSQERER